MLLSVDPSLSTGSIVTISYILLNLTITQPLRFATLYDNGTTVLAQNFSDDPPLVLANLWKYTFLPNGTSELQNLESGRRLSLNISDIFEEFWDVHVFEGNLDNFWLPNVTNSNYYNIDLPLAPGTAGPSPFPERIALQLDADGLLTTGEYDPLNPSFDPPPGLWFLRPRPPEVTTCREPLRQPRRRDSNEYHLHC